MTATNKNLYYHNVTLLLNTLTFDTHTVSSADANLPCGPFAVHQEIIVQEEHSLLHVSS